MFLTKTLANDFNWGYALSNKKEGTPWHFGWK